MVAYTALVAFWALSAVDLPLYLTLLKIAVLSLAAHVIFRTPRQLLLLFGFYSTSGLITLILNWADIMDLRAAMAAGDSITDGQRFAGTFGNANVAGQYGIMVCLCATILFFNTRHRWRWPLFVSGLAAGVLIAALSGSRKAMLGMVVIAMAAPMLAFAGDRGQLLKWAKGMLLGVIALAAAFAVLRQVPHLERLTRLSEGASGMDSSAQIRYDMAVTAFKLWLDRPIEGYGFEGYRVHSGFGTYSHTTFLEVLANGGLIGFSLIAIFYFLPPWQLLRLVLNHHQPEIRRLSAGLLCVWGMFFMYSLFSVCYASRDLIPICAAICGVVQAHARTPSKGGIANRTRGRPALQGKAMSAVRQERRQPGWN